jgi:alkylation response protein AidB-like acyl-CoA dehydrogenase
MSAATASRIADRPTPEDIVGRAKALAPKLRERSERAEELRRVPDETIADLVESRLPRICQPARYGGYELGWDTLCASSMELAQGCGSQAWVASVYAEHACLAGMFADEAQRDLWGKDPAALISSSYAPQGTVEAVSDGYVLSGRWTFSSGVHHAGWTVLGGLVRHAGVPPEHHFFLVPKSDRRIVDDWRTIGMAGTGSSSFELDKAFVPRHRSLPNRLIAEGRAPGAQVNAAPVFRMPVLGYANTALCAVCVGTAEGLVAAFGDGLRGRYKDPLPHGAENQLTRLAEAGAEVRAARLLVLAAARGFMAKLAAGETLAESDAATTGRDASFAAVLARRAATRVFEATGGHGLFHGNRLQRGFRDVFAGTAHIALNWDRASASYGRFAAGLPVVKLF